MKKRFIITLIGDIVTCICFIALMILGYFYVNQGGGFDTSLLQDNLIQQGFYLGIGFAFCLGGFVAFQGSILSLIFDIIFFKKKLKELFYE